MKQFDLSLWLQDNSRKVTTRYGNRDVRIICTDRKAKWPIVALMVDTDGNEYVTYHTKNGWCDEEEKYPDKRDLFFADEEPSEEFIDEYWFNTICHDIELRKGLSEKAGDKKGRDREQRLLDWLKSKKDLIVPKQDEEEELTDFEKSIKLFVDNNEERFRKGYKYTNGDIKSWAGDIVIDDMGVTEFIETMKKAMDD